jgi:hypothetical protein
MARIVVNEDRYIPANTNEGWGIIGLVIVLVIVCIAGATYLHKKTYRHPTDVTWQATGAAAPAAAHH